MTVGEDKKAKQQEHHDHGNKGELHIGRHRHPQQAKESRDDLIAESLVKEMEDKRRQKHAAHANRM